MSARQLKFSGIPDVRTTPATLTNIAGGDIAEKMNDALLQVAKLVNDDNFPIGSEFKIRGEITITKEDEEKLDVFAVVRLVLPNFRGIKTNLYFGRDGQLVIPVIDRNKLQREADAGGDDWRDEPDAER